MIYFRFTNRDNDLEKSGSKSRSVDLDFRQEGQEFITLFTADFKVVFFLLFDKGTLFPIELSLEYLKGVQITSRIRVKHSKIKLTVTTTVTCANIT